MMKTDGIGKGEFICIPFNQLFLPLPFGEEGQATNRLVGVVDHAL